MIDPDLRRLLVDAVGPVEDLDPEALCDRVQVRRRRRRTGTVAATVGVALLLALPLGTVLQPPEARVELAAGTGLVVVDAEADVAEGLVVGLSEAQRRLEPTRMPPGAVRCSEPTSGELSTTRWCLPGGRVIEVARGPHHTLPEEGEPIAVGGRTGYLRRTGDRLVLTASDADSMDDLHHRVSTTADVPAAVLAEVLSSVPAIADP